MPEFLRSAFAAPPIGNPLDVFIRLVVAALLGLGVALIYRGTRNPDDVSPTFPVTLMLLATLIALSTQVIGDNVARAFALVGALSIVRFRTVVRDTQDTAFVIFAVVIGMAVGSQNLMVAGIGIVVVGAAAFLMKPPPSKAWAGGSVFVITLRIALGYDLETTMGQTLDQFMASRHLIAIGTVKQGMSVEVAYRGLLRKDSETEAFVKALNRVDGIQSVDLTRESSTEE
jgi:Domain of unknown function (DUF4956)